MELSEFVTTLVERKVLENPVKHKGYTTYCVDDTKFKLCYVDLFSFIGGESPVSTIRVLDHHSAGIRVQFVNNELCPTIWVKPVDNDPRVRFNYDAFALYRLVKETI
jgi:hypothetical protein